MPVIRFLGMAVALLLYVQPVRAGLQVFEPVHVSAEALLPSVQVLLRPGESVSVHRDTLVVDAGEPSLQRVAQLLRELDKPLRNLLISLRRRSDASAQSGGTGVGGTVQGGDSSTISTRTGGHATQIEAHATRQISTGTRASEQSIRALEGTPVQIRNGQLVALGRGGEWAAIDYTEIAQGLAVSARVAGEQVTLELSAQNDRMDGSTLRTGSIESTVSGRLGEWIWLGSSTREDAARAEGITATWSTHSRGVEEYEVRVELAP